MKRFSRWLLGIIGVVALVVVAALVIPFLIDFSRFKPQIQKIVADKANANLDFASARLHVFPGLGVKLTKVTLTNTDPTFKGTRAFAVDEVFFSTELMPLFEKKLVGEVRIDKPEIVFAKNGLKNNFAAMVKTAPGGAGGESPAPEGNGGAGKPGAPGEEGLPDLKDRVLVKSLVIKDAAFKIADKTAAGTHEPVRLTNFDLRVENIGVDRDTVTELTSKVAVRDSGAQVDGPVVFRMRHRVTLNAKGLEAADAEGKLDFGDLGINVRDAFVKPRGVPMFVAFKAHATDRSANLGALEFVLQNLTVRGTGGVRDFKTLDGSIALTADNPDLSALGAILPQHKTMLSKGTLALTAHAEGPFAEPKRVTANVGLGVTLAGSDLRLDAKAQSLEPLALTTSVESHRLDLDALLGPFLPPQGSSPSDNASVATATEGTSSGTNSTTDGTTQPGASPAPEAPAKDFALTPDQKALLAGSDVQARVALQEVLFRGVTVKDFALDATVQDTIAELRQLAMAAFDGTLRTSGRVDLGADPIAFQNAFTLKGVQAGDVVGVIKPEHKGLVRGKLDLDLKAKGQGTTVPTLSRTLDGLGTFALSDAELHTGSVSDKMQESFDQYVSGLSIVATADKVFAEAEIVMQNPLVQKLPQAQSFNLDKYRQQYRTLGQVRLGDRLKADKTFKDVRGTIAIKQGRVHLETKPTATGHGTFAFDGSVGLDMSLAGDSRFTADESLKKALLAQSPYANLLFDDKGQLSLGMRLGGTALAPTVALEIKAMQDRFTQEAHKLVEKEVKKGADDFLAGLLKGNQAKLLEEVRKKEAELRAVAKAQEDKLRAEAKARESEEKKKLETEAKKKLKGLFNR